MTLNTTQLLLDLRTANTAEEVGEVLRAAGVLTTGTQAVLDAKIKTRDVLEGRLNDARSISDVTSRLRGHSHVPPHLLDAIDSNVALAATLQNFKMGMQASHNVEDTRRVLDELVDASFPSNAERSLARDHILEFRGRRVYPTMVAFALVSVLAVAIVGAAAILPDLPERASGDLYLALGQSVRALQAVYWAGLLSVTSLAAGVAATLDRRPDAAALAVLSAVVAIVTCAYLSATGPDVDAFRGRTLQVAPDGGPDSADAGVVERAPSEAPSDPCANDPRLTASRETLDRVTNYLERCMSRLLPTQSTGTLDASVPPATGNGALHK